MAFRQRSRRGQRTFPAAASSPAFHRTLTKRSYDANNARVRCPRNERNERSDSVSGGTEDIMRRKYIAVTSLLGLVAGLALLAAACGGTSNAVTPSSAAGATTMPPLTSGTLVGAGSTFAQPLYSQWGGDYQSVKGVKLNYQSIGSGGGIAQIKAKTVDFGASDAPLTSRGPRRTGSSSSPLVIGGVVPIVNVPGVSAGELKLDGDTLAEIFLGNVATWNDPAIAALNPGVKLPSTPITVVHRADGSGTTWIFTNYLAGVGRLAREGRRRQGRALADRRRRQGQRGRRRRRAADRRRHRLRRVRLRRRRTTGLRDAEEQGRRLRRADASRRSRPPRQSADWKNARRLTTSCSSTSPAGQLADHRRLLHPGHKQPARRRRAPRRCSTSSTGASRNGAEPGDELDYVPIPRRVVHADRWRSWTGLAVAGRPSGSETDGQP